MNDEGAFPNVRFENLKTSRRAFGDILDFQAVCKSDHNIKIESSISVNKVLGILNTRMISVYC